MHLIRSNEGNSVFYLLRNATYTIGRKQCDFIIDEDSSISRKHATIELKDEEVILTDLGAKYNTFVNDVKLEPNIKKNLKIHDVIKFGILNSEYTLEHVKIKSTCSSLTVDEKKKLSQNVKHLNGKLTNVWSKDCTHLTVREVMLTLKVLCALIEGQPIVTLKYWDDYVNNVETNTKPPDVSDYKPNCSEAMLNRSISLEYKPIRKTLFNNKIFVFSENTSKNNMEKIIELAGGTCLLWERNKISKKDLSKNKYLFIQDDSTSNDDSFSAMITHLQKLGKRSIPVQEIGMAVLMCSCEKDCNPDFDRSKILMEKDPKLMFSERVLVAETQTQPLGNETKTEFIVPPSITEDFFTIKKGPITSTQINSEANTSKITLDETRVKREGELFEGFCKRLKRDDEQKVENPFGFIRRTSTQREKTTDLFSESSWDISGIPVEIAESQVDKKRKADDKYIIDKPSKKQSDKSNPFVSTSVRSTTSTQVINPFAISIKQKKTTKDIKQEIINIDDVDSKPKRVKVNVNRQIEQNSNWLTKPLSICKENEMTINKSGDSVDEIMLQFINSFKNCIAFQTDNSLIVSRNCSVVDVSTSSNKINFKKFKKVTPIHIQTTIIPKSKYIPFVCNNKGTNEQEIDDEDDVVILENNTQTKPKRAKGKGIMAF